MSCKLPTLWTDEEWLTKNPERVSAAQVSVNDYLKRTYGKKLLHIGIGNSSTFKALKDNFEQIDGITNTNQEFEMAQKLGYRVYLMNKYDPEKLKKLDSDYNVIVDVNLKMYACCQEHWLEFLNGILGKLQYGGILVSHTAGFGAYPGEFDNSTTIEEIIRLLPSGFSLTKGKIDESGYYPFIIEKA